MQQVQQQNGTDIVIQGRIVWGGVKATTKKVFGTQTNAIDPKTGKEIIEYAFGLAIPKINPQSNQHEVENFTKFWNAVHTEAAKLGVQQGAQGFHWKYDDGDGRKKDGSEYPSHSKGHIVIACKTRLPLKLMAWEGNDIKQITEDQIKCGDYVQVSLNINAHGGVNAGMYINPSYVARFAFGEAIVNTAPVNGNAIFGNAPPPVPFGASTTPIGGGVMPGMPMQQPVAAAPVQPMQQYYGAMPPQFQPQQQAAPVAAAQGFAMPGMPPQFPMPK